MNRPTLVTDGSWSLSIFPATRFASCVKFRRGAASTAPNTTPPTKNAMASPARYWNSPSSVVKPDSVGVWYFRPAIGPAKTPARTGLRTNAGDFSMEVSFSLRVRALTRSQHFMGHLQLLRAALRLSQKRARASQHAIERVDTHDERNAAGSQAGPCGCDGFACSV